jgi:hypothetical protein
MVSSGQHFTDDQIIARGKLADFAIKFLNLQRDVPVVLTAEQHNTSILEAKENHGLEIIIPLSLATAEEALGIQGRIPATIGSKDISSSVTVGQMLEAMGWLQGGTFVTAPVDITKIFAASDQLRDLQVMPALAGVGVVSSVTAAASLGIAGNIGDH